MCIRCTMFREKGRDATIEEIYSYISSGGFIFKKSQFKGFESLDNKWVKVYMAIPYFSSPSHLLPPSYFDGWLRNLICEARLYEIGYCCDKKICYHLYEIEQLLSLKDRILKIAEWSGDENFEGMITHGETYWGEIPGLGRREIARFYMKPWEYATDFEKIHTRISDCHVRTHYLMPENSRPGKSWGDRDFAEFFQATYDETEPLRRLRY